MPSTKDMQGVLQAAFDESTGSLKTSSVGSSSEETAATTTQAVDVTVDGTAGGVTALAANTARISATVQNTGSADIRVGAPGITPTTSTGFLLRPGESVTFTGTAEKKCPTGAIKAIRTTGTSSTITASEES